MKPPSDEYYERLRRTNEEAQRSQQNRDDTGNQKKEKSVPFATMFKLQEGKNSEAPRQLQCVNCGFTLEWRIYTVSTELFDGRCSECGVKACDFWRGKSHRELKDA